MYFTQSFNHLMVPRITKKVFFFILFLMPAVSGLAQKRIEGTVKDAKTGETLPSANIIIKGVYRGTISNADGSYTLSIPDSLLPATVVVRYIGYHSRERVIEASSARRQDIELNPSVSQLSEIVVTDEDPAISIMKEVIRRKQQWHKKLHTYEADAYTRQSLANDTSIVMITESASKTFWDEKKGHREVITSRKQTANIKAADNLAGVRYIPNLYDDNTELFGFDLVGITNPDALKYYHFKLLSQTKMDSQLVYKIKVTPKRTLQPLFIGTVYVLDGDYALLEVDLKPNDVVRFPVLIKDFNLSYSQQFSNYGGDFWLPVDARIDGSLKIAMIGLKFPRMQFKYLSKISNYKVNVPLPDSLYKEQKLIRVDSATVNNDSLITKSVEPIPLSAKEKHAYATLDSTQTLEKAFKPHGFLARFLDLSVSAGSDDAGSAANQATSVHKKGIPGFFSPNLRYNRVDALFAGLNYSYTPVSGLKLSVNGGYSTGYEEGSYGGGIQKRWYKGRFRPTLEAAYQARTAPRYASQIINPTLSSIPNILGYENYFDYFRDEGFIIEGSIRDRRTDISLRAAFKSSHQKSLHTETAYDILGQHRVPRVNPDIDEGRMNKLDLTLGYNLDEGYAFGVIGQKRVALNVQYSGDVLGSDFNFTRYSAHIDWSFNTFYKRRLFPNTLELSLDAGTFSGQLPLQEFGVVDVSPSILGLFGGLHTVRFHPYEGEQYVALNVEHNFRTVPFERLGLNWLVEHNIGLILFGGAAKTWVSDQRRQQIFNKSGYVPHTTGGMHLETGISINGILDLFRVDFAQRLDEPAFLVSIGITRFF